MIGDASTVARLEKDPKYFIETFLWVVDKNRKKVPLILNPPQAAYYKLRTKNDLILKSRKEGFSTLIEALFLHACLFGRNENVVTMSHTIDDTVIHLDRVKFFLDTMGIDNFPLDCEIDKANQREISFPNTNSRYWIGTAGSRAFGRGRDVTRLHCSEIAHYENQSVLTGVMEACVPGATQVFETTANGVAEMFHRLWMEAGDKNVRSPWKRHFFAWHHDPSNELDPPPNYKDFMTPEHRRIKKQFSLSDRKIYWFMQKQASMVEKEKMPQEYPSHWEEAFLSSGSHVFDVPALVSMSKLCQPPVEVGFVDDDGRTVQVRPDPAERFSVWKHPRQGRKYLVAADVAEGVEGGDYSVAQVIDRASWEQVAVWHGRIDPGTFGKILCDIGYYYHNAILIPESNNHGWATLERIANEEYPHVLNSAELWPSEKNGRPGFPTNEKTRNMIITALRNAVTERTLYINDDSTIGEMMSFIRTDSGKMEAQEGSHDDRVMSLAIGCYSLKHLSVEETYDPRAKTKRNSLITVGSAVPPPPR
ncbi:MAG: hypothetical protein EKK55_17350 [Rhodocyclaceae bacterium]|nr:MAG: hypothetical protein EKK55_17350 [Rhodocyclaceae bacterium]